MTSIKSRDFRVLDIWDEMNIPLSQQLDHLLSGKKVINKMKKETVENIKIVTDKIKKLERQT